MALFAMLVIKKIAPIMFRFERSSISSVSFFFLPYVGLFLCHGRLLFLFHSLFLRFKKRSGCNIFFLTIFPFISIYIYI